MEAKERTNHRAQPILASKIFVSRLSPFLSFSVCGLDGLEVWWFPIDQQGPGTHISKPPTKGCLKVRSYINPWNRFVGFGLAESHANGMKMAYPCKEQEPKKAPLWQGGSSLQRRLSDSALSKRLIPHPAPKTPTQKPTLTQKMEKRGGLGKRGRSVGVIGSNVVIQRFNTLD